MRIENASDRQYDVTGLRKEGRPDTGAHCIPRATTGPGGVRVNGVGEIPDDVLFELLDKDVWTKAVFESGDLVFAGKKSVPDKTAK